MQQVKLEAAEGLLDEADGQFEAGQCSEAAESVQFQVWGDLDCSEFEERTIWAAVTELLDRDAQGEILSRAVDKKWSTVKKALKPVFNHAYRELQESMGDTELKERMGDKFAEFVKQSKSKGRHADQLKGEDFFHASALLVEGAVMKWPKREREKVKGPLHQIKEWRTQEARLLFYANLYIHHHQDSVRELDAAVQSRQRDERQLRFAHAVEILAGTAIPY
ncbi:hypothetical protein B484DRAFT_454443 [Ochromonadaceae sp. CCMP2298]|nr:hypothetical protein B484DRAFT_454443 [Ochromonadaceae sp. CCMP2298]